MIKKLRRKFILVIMSIVTVLMIAAFVSVLAFTSRNMLRQTDFVLDNALAGLSRIVPADKPLDRGMPSLTVIMDKNGDIIAESNQIFNLPDSAITDITNQALGTRGYSDILLDYSLRFLIQETSAGSVHLAFADISAETSMIENLLINSALIGAATLLIFFGVSVLLARWVVRPVEKSWNSQRQFVADASHELRTPLTVVLSNVEMLLGEEHRNDIKTHNRLENISEESKRMKILVDEMLEIARSDSVSKPVAVDTVDFSALMNKAVLMFEPILYDAGKQFDYSITDELSVTGDISKLRQIPEILLDNAAKYSPSGSRVSVSLRYAGKNEVRLEISNESETVPKEELTRIFERFYRLDKSRSSEGYGLGLAIADSLVREHGGKIGAKSEDGRLTFVVQLPAVRKSI